MQINKTAHIRQISEAIQELQQLSSQTASPASEPIQYIGTSIDNTIGLLTAPANSLDGGGRYIDYSDDKNWLSLMQAVHRSFFSSIHSSTEVALKVICKEHNITVESSSLKRAKKLAEKLAGKITETERKKIISLAIKEQSFLDYLQAVLKNSLLSKEQHEKWKNFFKALGVIRNKASHGFYGPEILTPRDVETLINGGFLVFVNNSSLQMNPRMYYQTAHFIIQFFCELADRIKVGSTPATVPARAAPIRQ